MIENALVIGKDISPSESNEILVNDLRMRDNGEIYISGNLYMTDKDIVLQFRSFLKLMFMTKKINDLLSKGSQ